ncbi:MAG: ABC transporter permease [Caldilineales bacterium]|nr:ABC transporter permease [Caldilineales bacterium]
MRDLFLIARYEYVKLAVRRSFLLATLGIPAMIGAILALSIVVSVRGEVQALPLGVVDQSGQMPLAASDQLRIFAEIPTANAALQTGEIQGYAVLAADYAQSGIAEYFYKEKSPSDEAIDSLNATLRWALLADQPQSIRTRVLSDIDVSIQSQDGERQADESNFINFILPFFIGMFFVFVVLGSSGFLLQAISSEKENLTVEVMFTSTSPSRLVGGKVLGLLAVALTQIGLWLLVLVLGVTFASRYVDFLQGLQVSMPFLLLVLVFFLPTYALIAGITTAIGSIVGELQHGQQIAGLINLLFVMPFFFTVLVFTNPNSPVLTALTIFPTTAFITVAMRWGVTDIPAWQLAAGFTSVTLTAVVAVFVAASVFRTGMLRYGQSLKLVQALRIARNRG